MEQRRSTPWAWIIGFVVLLLVVAVVAYWFGAGDPHHMVASRIFPRFGFGFLGFLVPVLVVALLVGLAVAALVPSGRRTESFEEWHRRAHGQGATEHSAPPPPTTAGEATTSDESGSPGQGT
jgi:formate hydrogenlyase subunit 3/multisubunit Na+/H+ antiporter MnhD subunit